MGMDMFATPFDRLFEELNRAGVRYVVVDGLAMMLRGRADEAEDFGLMVDFDPAQARAVIDTLLAVGLQVGIAVHPHNFADASKRASWIEQRRLRTMPFRHPTGPFLRLGLYLEHPIALDDIWHRSELIRFGPIECGSRVFRI